MSTRKKEGRGIHISSRFEKCEARRFQRARNLMQGRAFFTSLQTQKISEVGPLVRTAGGRAISEKKRREHFKLRPRRPKRTNERSLSCRRREDDPTSLPVLDASIARRIAQRVFRPLSARARLRSCVSDRPCLVKPQGSAHRSIKTQALARRLTRGGVLSKPPIARGRLDAAHEIIVIVGTSMIA